jgi:hypothetical protein
MKFPPPRQIALIAAAILGGALGLYLLDRLLPPRWRGLYRVIVLALVFGGFFFGLGQLFTDQGLEVDLTKGAIALFGAAAVFHEARRAAVQRPVSERWKRFVGVTLGVAAILTYFNGLRIGYFKFYHRWDQYHYYIGAKYFRELGYDSLYKCGVTAQDELGEYRYTNEDTGRPSLIDMSREVRSPDKKIRNLGGDNLLMSAADTLAHPERCKERFSPERWEEYKKDVAFFRTQTDKTYWEDMQKDHGFNPPPVWTIAGHLFANAAPASTHYLQFLASLDVLYLIGMFVALYWAFGWRVFAASAIFWGCQSPAPFYWTGGAFLRQDWLFWMVFSACLLRKRYFALGAAALVYSALLRIFPGLVVVGWLGALGWQIYRHRKLTPWQVRMLAGGAIAAAVLVPASIAVCGAGSYRQFYEHTLEVHDQTPLTNHMGLRVLVAQKTPVEFDRIDLSWARLGYLQLPFSVGMGRDSGRMKYTKDNSLADPFKVWKAMRNERYAQMKPVAYAIVLASLAFFVYVLRRVKNMWLAMCLAQVFVILLSQLTCYYYTFMILGAPLVRVKKVRAFVELSLFGLVILSQVAYRIFYWNDDKYWVLTLLCLLACYGQIAAFAPSALWARIKERLRPGGGRRLEASRESASVGT